MVKWAAPGAFSRETVFEQFFLRGEVLPIDVGHLNIGTVSYLGLPSTGTLALLVVGNQYSVSPGRGL
jgi:hypothetical protein